MLAKDAQWIAPEFLLVEVGNVLRTKVGRGQIDSAQAYAGIEFIRQTVSTLIADRELFPRAFEMALELVHPVYDCLYLACAEREQTRMITADLKLANKVGASRFAALADTLAI